MDYNPAVEHLNDELTISVEDIVPGLCNCSNLLYLSEIRWQLDWLTITGVIRPYAHSDGEHSEGEASKTSNQICFILKYVNGLLLYNFYRNDKKIACWGFVVRPETYSWATHKFFPLELLNSEFTILQISSSLTHKTLNLARNYHHLSCGKGSTLRAFALFKKM